MLKKGIYKSRQTGQNCFLMNFSHHNGMHVLCFPARHDVPKTNGGSSGEWCHLSSILQTSHVNPAIYANARRSSGTLLPLPALYLLGPPINCLGIGKASSGWNLNLVSWTTNLAPPPPPPPTWLVPRERPGEPPFVRVYADASMGCNVPELDPRD